MPHQEVVKQPRCFSGKVGEIRGKHTDLKKHRKLKEGEEDWETREICGIQPAQNLTVIITI